MNAVKNSDGNRLDVERLAGCVHVWTSDMSPDINNLTTNEAASDWLLKFFFSWSRWTVNKRIGGKAIGTQVKGKGKGKVLPRTSHEGPEGEQMYSSTLPSTPALDGGRWATPRLGRFTSGKDSVPTVQEAGWAPGPVRTGAENLALTPGFDPRTVQPVASRYTDWAKVK